MAVTEITLPSLKRAKNDIIGNPTAKRAMAKNEAFIEALVYYIRNSDPITGESCALPDELRLEAAHIVASLSYGSPDALKSLLRANALQALLIAIPESKSVAMRAALARALKSLSAAVSDVVGPSQWGLQAQSAEDIVEARSAQELLFENQALRVYLTLLQDSSTQVSMAIAQLLAATLRTQICRMTVSEWVHPSEWKKQVVVSRGWEKQIDQAQLPSRGGGWVARQLVSLLQRKDAKLQEAVLWALAALTKGYCPVAEKLASSAPGHVDILPTVLSLCKSRLTDLQLAACLCASNIFRASWAVQNTTQEHSAPMTIIHVINGLLESETESPQTRMKACYILCNLVEDNKDLCHLAYDRGSIAKLATLVKSITPSEPSVSPNWDEDEPDSVSSLRAAALTAIAAISLFDTDIRGEVSGTFRLIPYIAASLSHRHVGVRYAACQCVRALSRAVAVLRTNLVDSGLSLAVFQVFCKEGEDSRVTHAAASVICNIISDFSPLQATLLEQGVTERLVQLLHSGDSTLMLDALWAFKNLLYKSSLELKRRAMNALSWTTAISLLRHENPGFQEQILYILRNVADCQEGIDMIFDEIGSEELLNSLGNSLESGNEDVVRQAVYLTGNLSNSTIHSSEVLADTRILHALRLCLVDGKADVRRAAVGCVLQLVKANPGCQKVLHDCGIDSTLRHMCEYGTEPFGMSGYSPTTMYLRMGTEYDREVKEKAREILNRLVVTVPEWD